MSKSLSIIFGSFAAILVIAAIIGIQIAYGGVGTRIPTNQSGELVPFTFFSATTTNATSTNLADGGGSFTIAGAKRVLFYFARGGVTNPNLGSSKFNVQVTPDGTNWYDFPDLRQVAATSTSNINRVQFVTVPAGTSTVLYSMETLGFLGARCIVFETTDGEHTCTAQAEF